MERSEFYSIVFDAQTEDLIWSTKVIIKAISAYSDWFQWCHLNATIPLDWGVLGGKTVS